MPELGEWLIFPRQATPHFFQAAPAFGEGVVKAHACGRVALRSELRSPLPHDVRCVRCLKARLPEVSEPIPEARS